MPGIGLAPGRPVAMEDVCDLQPRAAHGRRTTPRFSVSLRSAVRAGRAAGHSADRGVGDARVKGRGVEFGMAERTRAIMLTFYVIETESSVGRDPMLAGAARAFVRDTLPGPLP